MIRNTPGRSAAARALAGALLAAASVPASALTIDPPVTVSEPGTFSLFAIAVAAAVIVARLRRRR